MKAIIKGISVEGEVKELCELIRTLSNTAMTETNKPEKKEQENDWERSLINEPERANIDILRLFVDSFPGNSVTNVYGKKIS